MKQKFRLFGSSFNFCCCGNLWIFLVVQDHDYDAEATLMSDKIGKAVQGSGFLVHFHPFCYGET